MRTIFEAIEVPEILALLVFALFATGAECWLQLPL
jgi:hypothetical protein